MPPKGRKKIQRGGDASPAEIQEMKALGRRCADLVAVQNYVERLCNDMVAVVSAYAKDTNKPVNKTLQDCFCLPKWSPHMTGNVCGPDVAAVVESGNVRERMTLLANFWNHGCEVAIWAASDSARSKALALRSERVDEIKKQVEESTGLDIATFNDLVCSGPKCGLTCDLALRSRDSPPALARSKMSPYTDGVRVLRCGSDSAECDGKTALKQTFGDAYPPLSEREIRYMKLKSQTPDTPLPWLTGAMLWSASNESSNLYASIATKYGHVTVAGPSGTTNEVLATCSMLPSFDIELSMLAHMAWMCNPPHHSPFEILVAGIAYGCAYRATEPAYAFVETLVQKHSSAAGGGKRRAVKSSAAKPRAVKKPAQKKA